MDWVELISTVGFPIACVVALCIFVWNLYLASVSREERLMQVNEKAIDTIAKYSEKLEIIQHDVEEIKHELTTIMR